MSPQRWQRIKEVAFAAIELEEEERVAFLDNECGPDQDLRDSIEGLLEEDRQPGGSIEKAIAAAAAQIQKSPGAAGTESMLGRTISHYKIVGKLGKGGMGVVYKAEDTELDRPVALKFLAPHLVETQEGRQRFTHEAQAASALDHPNICTIYEIGEADDGQMFIVMAYYEGETLQAKIARGPLDAAEAADLTAQMADGLAKAHGAGIVHRDLKPANVIVTSDGVVKILDFGLAKLAGATKITKTGSTMGTPQYMSPEQAQGIEADHRTDLWALGTILYEMLTGETAFKGEREAAVLYGILNRQPKPIAELRPNASAAFQQVVDGLLQKDKEKRAGSAADVSREIKEIHSELAVPGGPAGSLLRPLHLLRRPKVALLGLATILIVGLLAGWFIRQQSRARWARETALPEIQRLIEGDEYFDAFRLLREAETQLDDEDVLGPLWEQASVQVSVESNPTEAEVSISEYTQGNGGWLHLGHTPLTDIRVPDGFLRWRVVKEGYETSETAWFGRRQMEFSLSEVGKLPPGKVHVVGGNLNAHVTGPDPNNRVRAGDFLMDQYEVTNQAYKAFVDQGGYTTKEYWKQPVIEDGVELSWDEGMSRLVDRTGMPSPAGWKLEDYPDGQEDYPVTGVSWYEAEAYCEFKGERLPTVYHWIRAAGTPGGTHIIPSSNFSGSGPSRVGQYQGLSRSGAYDMAGNVREWCWNDSRGQRYILGGAWSDPSYMFTYASVRPPLDRTLTNGFRCARYLDGNEAGSAFEPVELLARDYNKEKPVGDDIFRVYADQFSYDPSELKAQIESEDNDSAEWSEQRVSFKAAYDGERVIAYLFIPKQVQPPYQAVVLFPGAGVIRGGAIHDDSSYLNVVLFTVKTGRVLVWPIYKGTNERQEALASIWPNETHQYSDYVTAWVQDFRRTIDYLETREDIDQDKLTYLGVSWGAIMGTIIPAVEDRLKAAVLWSGGLTSGKARPEVDQINFVSRVKIPVLMLNGRYDSIFPHEAAQLPLFRLLGTPEADKRHIVYEAGHRLPKNKVVKETLSWLERYLGPVE